MKNVVYLLNEGVIFIPGACTLHAQDKKIVLNSPSARCLHLLLMKGALTPQHELYAFGWNNPSEITPNNLYQNISLIRRSLTGIFKKQGKYIVTVTRKGFCVGPDLIYEQIKIENMEMIINREGFTFQNLYRR